MIDFHPLANLFPLIEGDEFDHLVEDIRENGLRDQIVLLGGQVLDGRNRYRAGMLAERVDADDVTSANFREFDPEQDGEPLAFVLSKNLARRHLNESQRAMVAARIANLPGGRPEKTPPIGGVKTDDAAKSLNVGKRSIERARVVQDRGTPALIHAVEQGKLPVSAAAQASKLGLKQQDEIAAQAEAGKANVVRTVIKQGIRNEREKALGQKQRALPDKKYGVILMDPEWRFEPYSRATGLDRAADNHYPTSDQRMLLMREIGKISAKDCMCAMWVTDLTNGVRLMESYGLQVKSRIIWVKDIVECPRNEAGQRTYVQVGPAGTGYWARDRAEILLIGTRGDFPAPAPGTQGESVWFAARGRHSEKPEEAYLWIEKHWPNLPKIELNARAARPGWDRWGNEAPVEQDGGREIGAALSVAPPAVHNGQGATMAEQSAEPAAVSHGGSRTPGETDCVTAGETAPIYESAAAIAASLGSGPRWQNRIAKTNDFDADRDMPEFLRRGVAAP